MIQMDFGRLFQFKNLKPIARLSVDTSHALTMRGVGIVLSIVGQALRRFISGRSRDGQVHRPLRSAVRAVTGTPMNEFAFFGVGGKPGTA